MDTKALRQKMLDLAIRGKLVPQDPNDEPASVLLERIRAQKQQMVREGELKSKDIKDDTVIFVGEDNLHYEKYADGTVKCIEDETPFELPDGWEWARLGSIAESDLGKMLDAAKNKGLPRPYLRNINVRWGVFDLTDLLEMRIQDEEVERYSVQKGDLVVCEGGEPGRCAIWEAENGIFFQKALHRVRPHLVSSEYLYLVIYALSLSGFTERYFTGTTIKHLTGQALKALLIPIPPIYEQGRICRAANKALGIVDDIEKNNEVLIPTLSLAKTRILDLAIRGLLVPQSPDDEPASVLLDCIRAEKEKLIKRGRIKCDKRESIIFRGDDNSYYLQTGNLIESLSDWGFDDLPDSWAICCLGEICDYGNCINVETDSIDDDAWMLDLEDIEKDTGKVLVRVKKRDRNAASTKHQFHAGQVLYSKLRPYLNKVVLADQDGFCTSEILPLEFECIVVPEYARYYLMSPAFLRYANHCSYGVKMPRLGTADGKKAIVPLPPYKEQERIVKAVHKTFALLDSIAESLS